MINFDNHKFLHKTFKKMTQEEFRLYTEGQVKLAIPIIATGRALNPKPNFLIFTNIWSDLGLYTYFPDQNGIPQKVEAKGSQSKIVYREWLAADGDKPAIMRECIFDEIGYQLMADDEVFSQMLKTKQKQIANADAINHLLSSFSFRGILKGLKMTIDTQSLNDYLSLEANIAEELKNPPPLTEIFQPIDPIEEYIL